MDVMKGKVANNSTTNKLHRGSKVAPEGQGLEKLERGNWGGKLEFILTCIGLSVGLGNVWRFPYLCFKNGGGAFLIPYWIMQLFVGMPLFFMELCFGQFASLGPLAIWKVSPLFKGIGFAMVIVTSFVGLYYNIIIGYSFFFFFASMTNCLPWSHCNNEWNSPNCHQGSHTISSDCPQGNLSASGGDGTIAASEDYFERYVLDQSRGLEDIGGMRWQLVLCLILAWLVVFAVLVKGIRTLGKVVYFTAIFPYFLLLALLIRGATLDGAGNGVYYYLTPDWSRLADSTVWSDAATQVFFSLGTCSGGLILMSSFNKFDNNCLRDALIVPIVDCLTSFFSGFVIFTVLGFMAHSKGVEIEDVAASGPGLAFVVYPEAVATMPLPTLWAVLFFLMMLVIGFSSQFTIVETVISSISDEFDFILRKNWRNSTLFRAGMCVLFFLLGLPMTTRGGVYLFSLVDTIVSGFPFLCVGFFECIALNYVYGYSNFAGDIEMMLGKKPFIYWRICWCFITPALLFAVIVFKAVQYEPVMYGDHYVYPDWAQAIGWLICVFPLLFIPVCFLYRYCKEGSCTLGGWKLLVKLSRPLPGWGPALPESRRGRYANLESEHTPVKEESTGLPPTSQNGDLGSTGVAIPDIFTTDVESTTSPASDVVNSSEEGFQQRIETNSRVDSKPVPTAPAEAIGSGYSNPGYTGDEE